MLDILAFLKAHGYVYRSGGFWPFLDHTTTNEGPN
jgi:hypothetical protein